MSTELFVVYKAGDAYMLPGGELVEHPSDLPVGAMWRCECHDEQGWLIRLPGRTRYAEMWCTLTRSNGDQLWSVTGDPPNITVSPSINCLGTGGWHGHIADGVISDGEYNG